MEEVAEWIEAFGHVPRPWTKHDVFPLGQSTLSSLHHVARQVDGALFIFGDEDSKWYRNTAVRAPRDNILIEYGLFSGILGEASVGIVMTGQPMLASDVAGITYLSLNEKAAAKNRLKVWLNAMGSGMSRRDPRSPDSVPAILARATDSEESSISHLRAKFWSYHATRHNGQGLWRAGILDLSSLLARNKLLGTIAYKQLERDAPEIYAIDGLARDDALVLLQKRVPGAESAVVRVYPNGGSGYSDSLAGLSFHTNFDREPSISPTILSRAPLFGAEHPGSVKEPGIVESLNETWKALLGATRLAYQAPILRTDG